MKNEKKIELFQFTTLYVTITTQYTVLSILAVFRILNLNLNLNLNFNFYKKQKL
jgi:hypothetical protein